MPPGNGKGNGNGNGSGDQTTSNAAADDTYSTTLSINGFSILGNAATSNAPAANGGSIFIHKGTSVFEDDDIVIFTVENVTIDGVLTDNSVITGITVYDSALDYFNEVEKYSYSGAADIDVGRRTMGDKYLEFDAMGLTSSDSDAPALNQLTLVPGVKIQAEIEASGGKLVVQTFEDIDLNGDGEITEDEEADGRFTDDLNVLLVVCFAKGTLIETPEGPRYVETLKEGDLINTLDDGPQPIRWLGTHTSPGTGRNAPVRIKPGALGNLRTLYVSQNHRMLVSGPAAELLFGQAEVLVAAKHLVNDDSIRIVPRPQIDYVHFLFDKHQIVFAECCPAESLYPGPQTLEVVEEESRDEIIARFPELAHQEISSPMSRYALRKHEAMALRAIA